LPAYQRASQSLEQQACLDHLRQIGVAVGMYASEWDQKLPLKADGWGPWLLPLLPSRDIIYCPAETHRLGKDNDNPPHYYVYPGYVANNMMWFDAGHHWLGQPLDYFPYPQHFLMWADGNGYSHTTTPYRETINGTEYRWYDGGATNFSPQQADLAAVPPEANAFVGRHEAQLNCWFLDGHVGSIPIAELVNRRAYYCDAARMRWGGQTTP